MAQSQSSAVRRRRGDLLNIPWSQRTPEALRASDVSQFLTQIGSGRHAGKWKAVVRIPGEAKPKVFGPYPWERIDELIAKRDALLALIRDGKADKVERGREQKSPTLDVWVPEFLDIVRLVQGRAGKTVDNYKHGLRLVQKYLGGVRLDDFDRARITQDFMAAARADSHSIEAVNNSLKRLKTCLETAIGYSARTKITVNAAMPIRPIPRQKAKKLADYVTHPRETSRLYQAAGETYLASIIIVATDCGLRRSEIAGLQWGDIVLDAPQPYLRLRRHVVSEGEGKARLTLIKPGTKASGGKDEKVTLSKRAVIALNKARDLLIEHKLATRGWRAGAISKVRFEATGKAYVVPQHPVAPEAFVWPNRRTGDVHLPDTLGSWFDVVCAKAGITTKSGLHYLRHDCATFLLTATPPVPLAVVSKHMRHATSQITADTYSHLLKGQETLAADTFDRIHDGLEDRAAAV